MGHLTSDVSIDIDPASVLLFLKANLPSDPFFEFHHLPEISVQGEPLSPLGCAAICRKAAWDIPEGSQHNIHVSEKSLKNGRMSFSP